MGQKVDRREETAGELARRMTAVAGDTAATPISFLLSTALGRRPVGTAHHE
jgi:hypothetical protein